MIRLIIENKCLMPDGNSQTDHKTMDIIYPELEEYLTRNFGYSNMGWSRVVGSEVIKQEVKK